MRDRTADVREWWSRWWDRWEPAVAVAVCALIVLGLGLVFTGVIPLDDRVRTDPAQPQAATDRSSMPPAQLEADVPTSAPPSATSKPFLVEPGGPAVGSPAANRVVHAFASVPVGSTSPPLVLVVTNPLADPVEVRAVATRSASFTIRDDACTAVLLQPRTTCRLTVVFAPVSAGDAQSPVAVRIRQVCTGSVHWPCDAGESQIRTGVPDGARTVLPSGQVAVDWTTNLNDGWDDLWVEGSTG